jgi:hypothetical protein
MSPKLAPQRPFTMSDVSPRCAGNRTYQRPSKTTLKTQVGNDDAEYLDGLPSNVGWASTLLCHAIAVTATAAASQKFAWGRQLRSRGRMRSE